MKENVNMKEARVKLEGISDDARIQRIAELREKAILDEKEAKYTGYMNGLEEGRKDGLELGKQEGKEQGRKEGKKEGIEQIARKMKKTNFDIQTIKEITGLTEEEIEKIN